MSQHLGTEHGDQEGSGFAGKKAARHCGDSTDLPFLGVPTLDDREKQSPGWEVKSSLTSVPAGAETRCDLAQVTSCP